MYLEYIFSKDKKIGMTEFKRRLANMIGTTLSNIYEIIEDKKNKILTIKIDDNRPEFCNFTLFFKEPM